MVAGSLVGACGGGPSPQGGGEGAPPAAGMPSSRSPLLSSARFVDLSYGYDDTTLYWPTSPSRFELEPLAWGQTEGGYFYASNIFRTPEHGGTHLDAPIHFSSGGWTAAEIPLERLIAPAVVVDVREQAAGDADYRLVPADITSSEERNGRIPAGSIVLLRTGWGDFWPDARRYLGDDTPGDASDLHFPSYGEAAARLLVEERGVSILGVDTASIDHGPSSDFIVHRIANGANVPALENVANLEHVPERGAWIIALPVKITTGSGAPVRIVAVLPG